MPRRTLAVIVLSVSGLLAELLFLFIFKRQQQPESAPGPAHQEEVAADLPDENPSLAPTVKVPAISWMVSGRVVRDEPVAGVAVRLRRELSEPSKKVPPWRRTSTGTDGRFEFAGVPARVQHRLEVDEPSSALKVLVFETSGFEEDLRQDLGDIRLEPASTLVVKLTGPRDEPVSGGKVMLDHEEFEIRAALPRKDERGEEEFLFDRLVAGSYWIEASAPGHITARQVSVGLYELQAGAEGRKDSEIRDVQVAEERTIEGMDLVLESGESLSGLVVDAEGNPLGGASVKVDSREIETEEDGRFQAGGLSKGATLVFISKNGFAAKTLRTVLPAKELTVRLDRLARISGRVQAGARETFQKGKLTAQSRSEGGGSAPIDSAGHFQIAVPGGTYLLVASVPGFAGGQAEVAVEAGKKLEGVVIELRQGGTIRGRAVLRGSGAPVKDLRISVFPEGFQDRATGSDGSFLFEGVPEGEVEIHAHHDRYVSVAVPRIKVREGETSEVEIELAPGGAIHGTVRRGGKPGSGTHITAKLRGGDLTKEGSTSQQGRFEITGLPPASTS